MINLMASTPSVRNVVRFGNDPQVGKTLQNILKTPGNYNVTVQNERGYTTLKVKNTSGQTIEVRRDGLFVVSQAKLTMKANNVTYTSKDAKDIEACDQIITLNTKKAADTQKPDLDF